MRYCKHDDCKTHSTFNFEGELNGLYCAQHKLPNMVDVKSRRCNETGCVSLTPVFNYEGETHGMHCAKHKLPHMVNVKSQRCHETGCVAQPVFNYEGESKGLYCAQHKLPHMVNVTAKRCNETGCTKQPTFNNKGEPKGLYCAQHKQPNMVDVKSKRCNETGCVVGPAFNYEGESKGMYCAKHKQPNMVNVTHKRCNETGCVLNPVFNYEGESKGLYCAQHKLPHMVNVTSKRCNETGCTKQPRYGIPGQTPVRCAEHKVNGTIPYPKRRCEQDDCKEYALYGMNSTPQYCETHKSSYHTNLVQHECAVCSVLEITDDEGKCSRCSEYLVKKLHLRKQRLVKCWLDSDPTLCRYESYDRQIENGSCGKERPDFVWDTPTHKVILEVDEFQHRERPCECEQTRMVNVTQSLGMPCLWIRFNPDDFKGQKASLREQHRRELLTKVLTESLSDIPTSSCDILRIKHLYFDGFQVGQSIPIERMPIL